MKRKYIKSDATECEAHIGATTLFGHNGLNTYKGKIIFSDKGMTLFSHTVPVERLNREDAVMDAVDALHNGEFGDWC